MKYNPPSVFSIFVVALAVVIVGASASLGGSLPVPKIPYVPRHYVCYRTTEVMTIDGLLHEDAWKKNDPSRTPVSRGRQGQSPENAVQQGLGDYSG